MKDSSTPIPVVPIVNEGDTITILSYNGETTIGPSAAEKLKRILHYCNGHNDLRAIATLSGLSLIEVQEYLTDLEELKAVVDSTKQFIHFHRVSSYPAYYPVKNCPHETLPLRFYVMVGEGQSEMEPGYYEYNKRTGNMEPITHDIDVEQLKYCFNRSDFELKMQFVIAADFTKLNHMYPNRAYRSLLLKAGKITGEIISCIEESDYIVGDFEEFLDGPLRGELKLPKVYPLISFSVEKKSEYVCNKEEPYDMELVYKYVGNDKPLKNIWAETFGKDGSFFGAGTTYCSANGIIQYAGGTGTSYNEAVFKAAIEGYERWRSSQVRVDYRGRAKDLKSWLDPDEYFPLTKEQTEKYGVNYFTPTLSLDWTIGEKMDGSKIYIPSDLVYYGQRPSRNCIYKGHSSGIAAHTDIEEAKKRAIVELIERDALMRNWYSRKSPNRFKESVLPIHVRKRIEHWQNKGRKLYILSQPSDYGLVFEAIIVSNDYPCFVSGAAATIDYDEVDSTIMKALQEAEYSLLLCLRYLPKARSVNPLRVRTPMDHGRLYYSKRYAESLAWLWDGDEVESAPELPQASYEELLRKLDPITVNLSEPGSELKVLRVFSSKLVPINFGFYSAHYTHPELSDQVNPDSLKLPHYFS